MRCGRHLVAHCHPPPFITHPAPVASLRHKFDLGPERWKSDSGTRESLWFPVQAVGP